MCTSGRESVISIPYKYLENKMEFFKDALESKSNLLDKKDNLGLCRGCVVVWAACLRSRNRSWRFRIDFTTFQINITRRGQPLDRTIQDQAGFDSGL